MKTWKNSAHFIFMSHVLHSYGRKPSGQQRKPSHYEYVPWFTQHETWRKFPTHYFLRVFVFILRNCATFNKLSSH